MPKKSNLIQIAIIIVSMLILISSVYFAFTYTTAQISSTNLFESNTETRELIAVPVNYETRISKGDSFIKAEQYSMAASEYAFAINVQVENAQAYAKLGEVYLKTNESEKAAQQFKTASELEPDNSEYLGKHALALMRNNQFEEASKVLAKITYASGLIIDTKKETQETSFYSALLFTFQEDYKEAKKQLEKAADLKGTVNSEVLEYFQSAFANYDSQKEGQDIYLEALIVQALVDSEEYELAENMALHILNKKNDYRDVWILLGYAQLKMERFQEAEDAFKQARTLDAVKPETHYFIATSHFLQEEYEEAVAEYELALLYDFEPEEEIYKKIAESQLFLEDYEEAVEAYEYLINIDHSNIEGFVRPVWLAITELEDLDRALSIAKESVEYFPNEAMSYNLLGWTHLERTELEDADLALEIALKIDGKLAATHYNIGRLKELQGDTEAAANAYENAYQFADSTDPINAMAAEKHNSLILIQ